MYPKASIAIAILRVQLVNLYPYRLVNLENSRIIAPTCHLVKCLFNDALGASSEEKYTLVSLLLRLYNFKQGRVLKDSS